MLPPQIIPASGDRRLNHDLLEQIALIKACVAQAVASEVLPLNTMLRCSNREISMKLVSLEKQIKQVWMGNHGKPEKMSSHIDREKHFRFDSVDTGQSEIEMIVNTNSTNQTNSAPAPAVDADDKDGNVIFMSSNPPLEINLLSHIDPPRSISSPDIQTECDETPDRVGVPVPTTSNIHELKKASLDSHLKLDTLLTPLKMDRSPSLANFNKEASRRAESSSLLSGIRSIKGVLLFNNIPTTMYRRRDMARKVPACVDSLPPCLNDALRSTLDHVFGISDPNIWVGHPGSSVVHPNSLFNKGPPTFSSRTTHPDS
jgi:hypothetical protein